MKTVTDLERRARLARRHALLSSDRAASVEDAAARMVCLHATDPSTIVLSAWARIDGFAVGDLERAMYVDRTLVKHLAMRRTLFVFPRDVLGMAQAGASARVHEAERGRLTREVVKSAVHPDGDAWYAELSAAVLAQLAPGQQRSVRHLKAELPQLDAKIQSGAGKWATEMAVGSRLLTAMGANGQIVRAVNDGAWWVSRPEWASMESWLGEPLVVPSAADGTRGLVERWLRAFGPGTTTDIKWWLGGTVKATKQALAELEAVEVALEGGGTGWLLPDDVEPEPAVEPWGALLPGLDPTTMGWKERDWYLGDYQAQLFDNVGNGGPTIWWDGRIIGAWRQAQTPQATVELLYLEDPGADARALLEAEAERLTTWINGVRVMPRFPSPLTRRGINGR